MKSKLSMMQKEFYWSNMYELVMPMVKGCFESRNRSFGGQKTKNTRLKDDGLWQRLHWDSAFKNSTANILIIADSFSGCLEAL